MSFEFNEFGILDTSSFSPEYDDAINDKLLFTEDDVKSCQQPLMKLLREIMFSGGVTLRQFIEKHDAYMNSINATQRENNYKKNNILKVILRKDEITFKLFSYIITKILKNNLTSFSGTLIDTKGTLTEHKVKCNL